MYTWSRTTQNNVISTLTQKLLWTFKCHTYVILNVLNNLNIFEVNTRKKTRKRSEICSKLIIKTASSNVVQMFLLLPLN